MIGMLGGAIFQEINDSAIAHFCIL